MSGMDNLAAFSEFKVLECIKALKSAGFTQEQAEAQAGQMEKLRSELATNLATKENLEATKEDIKRELIALEHKLLWKMMVAMAALLGSAKILSFLPDFIQ